uniref:ribonuclease III domain-containing protein n=1 Tax=Roseivirga sp. TaxID=1964215 RepID=UPI004047FE40
MRLWLSRFKPLSKEDRKLIASIQQIVGSRPLNLKPYKIATQHSSIAKSTVNGFKESNERLEFLGDAVLGLVVADFLFKKYPFKDEGIAKASIDGSFLGFIECKIQL